MRLTGKDLAATLFTGAAVGAYAVFAHGADVPMLSSVRGTTLVVLVLGWVGGCALSDVGDAYTGKQKTPAMVAVLTTLGGVALAAAVVGLVTGSEAALTVLVLTTVLLWLGSTARHLATRSPHSTPRTTLEATHDAPPHRMMPV